MITAGVILLAPLVPEGAATLAERLTTTPITELAKTNQGLEQMLGVAHAEEPYTTSAEITCGNVRVRVVTECYDDSNYPSLPGCSKQYFEFWDPGTGKRVTVPASGDLTAAEHAVSWACVKGTRRSYLLVMYTTGGNCEGCEWAEIVDLNGKKLASDRATPRYEGNKHFKKVYAQLGLPKQWPRASFSWIPLDRPSGGEHHD